MRIVLVFECPLSPYWMDFCFLNMQLSKGHRLEGCVVSSRPPLVCSITSFLLGLWIYLISFSYAKKYGYRGLPHRIPSQSNTFCIIKAKATYHFHCCNRFNYCQHVKIFLSRINVRHWSCKGNYKLSGSEKIVHCVKNSIGPNYNTAIHLLKWRCWYLFSLLIKYFSYHHDTLITANDFILSKWQK